VILVLDRHSLENDPNRERNFLSIATATTDDVTDQYNYCPDYFPLTNPPCFRGEIKGEYSTCDAHRSLVTFVPIKLGQMSVFSDRQQF